MKLTETRIEKLQDRGLYSDEATLYLKVSPTKTKCWIQRIVINGKRHDVGLGPWPEISLEMAREDAFENRRKVARGINILAEKRKEQNPVPAFQQFAEEYITAHEKAWKRGVRTGKEWRFSLKRYVYGRIGAAVGVRYIKYGRVPDS